MRTSDGDAALRKQLVLVLLLWLASLSEGFYHLSAPTKETWSTTSRRRVVLSTYTTPAFGTIVSNMYDAPLPVHVPSGAKKNPHYPDYPFDKYLANPFFSKINTQYPGLQLIHEEPFIFLINEFLSPDECTRLANKAREGLLRPQIGGGGVVRTSKGVVCPHDEVPGVQSKLMELVQVPDKRQFQFLKVSHYGPGDTFSKHTDAWPTEGAPISQGWVEAEDFFGDNRRPIDGCLSSNNQPNQNTLLTTFIYLNDVTDGGCTTFPNIGIHGGRDGRNFYEDPSPMDSRCRPDTAAPWNWDYRTNPAPLSIAPEQGMAVLHFCALLAEHGGICDGNTFHVAEPPAAGQEKYVAQQFVASCNNWSLPDDSIPFGRVTWDTV